MKELDETVERWKAPTPPYFKGVRRVGLMLAAAGGAVVTFPLPLPPMVTTIAGYILLAGTVLASVAQVNKEDR